MASFEQIVQSLRKSHKGRSDFFQAVLDTLKLYESRFSGEAVLAILNMANRKLGNRPQEYQQLLQDLKKQILEAKDPTYYSWTAPLELLKYLLQDQPVSLPQSVRERKVAAEEPAIDPQLVNPVTMSFASGRPPQTLAVPDMAYKDSDGMRSGDLHGLTPPSDAVINLTSHPGNSETSPLLANKAKKMRKIVRGLYDGDNAQGGGSDTDNAMTGLALPPSPNTEAYRRVAVRINKFETYLYLTSHSNAPLIVTLLNALALSGRKVHSPKDAPGALRMDMMQDFVTNAWEARLVAMHDFQLWPSLAQCLDLPLEVANLAVQNGKVTEAFLLEMRALLDTYFGLPTMPTQEEALSKCSRMFQALLLCFEVREIASLPKQGSRGPSLTGNWAAEDRPSANAPLTCSQGSEGQGADDIGQRSAEGELGGPASHVAPEMPMLDRKTYEELRQEHCRPGFVASFLYTAKGQGTLHVMVADMGELYVLNQTEAPRGGSHGHGPFPRWFRLTWQLEDMSYIPCDLQFKSLA